MLVHNTVDLYGASRSLLRLSTGLLAKGDEVHVVLPGRGPLNEKLREAGVQVVEHPWLWTVDRASMAGPRGVVHFLASAVPSVFFMSGLMIRRRIDVVHSNTAIILAPAFAARLLGRPHIWHIREFFSEFPGFWNAHCRAMRFLSTRIVAVSQAVADQFPLSCRLRLRVIHNGFPAAEFAPVAAERVQNFRRIYNLGPHRVVGIIGRIKWKRKGQEVFVRAAARLKERFPETLFVVVGSPYPGNEDHLTRLRLLIRELGLEGSVLCTGDAEDIKAAYAAMDIVVLASTQPEPFGGVVIEAMALGRPVIGSRIGGTPEQIEDRVTGLLFEPGDDQDLAMRVRRTAQRPRT